VTNSHGVSERGQLFVRVYGRDNHNRVCFACLFSRVKKSPDWENTVIHN